MSCARTPIFCFLFSSFFIVYVLPSICNSLARVLPREMILAFSLASDEITTFPLTVRSLLTVVSPLNITLKASDLFEEFVPFPITKAVFEVLNEVALFVTEEPEELYCPITNEA